MIFFDVTKTGVATHRSGLVRVSTRLREELGAAAEEVRWPAWPQGVQAGDWYLTSEVFAPDERAGFDARLERRPCRFAAIFHDAIPLKHPYITWPQSVARHASYLKMLSRFDRVWAVSHASRQELIELWRWQGVERMPPVDVLLLGADFSRQPRVTAPPILPRRAPRPSLLCLGIVEPRKNQDFLLTVAEQLWRGGCEFDLHVVGRVNPHFGRPIVARLKAVRRNFPGLTFHEAAGDVEVAQLIAGARAVVFPTIAEGCGLPLLEALWLGVPCVCSDLPALRENIGPGCVAIPPNDADAWRASLRRVLTDDAWHDQLVHGATTRELPTWRAAAERLQRELAGI